MVGCGDVGLRVARGLQGRVRLLALTSTAARKDELRGKGVTPLAGNLDQPSTLARLAGLATRVIHLAPPPGEGHQEWWRDQRTVALLRAATHPDEALANRLHQLSRTAFNLRDRMSADNWRTLNSLTADPVFQRGAALLVAEGYMDVIALAQHGITYAVATLGIAVKPGDELYSYLG